MLNVVITLRGYQVGSKLPLLRPFGHLYIEYSMVGAEPWILRGGPKIDRAGLVVNVENTLASESRDSLRSIHPRTPTTLIRCDLEIGYSFSQFINEIRALTAEINRTRTRYGLFYDNSNSVATLAWNCVTGQEFVLANNYNGYIYPGLESVKISRRLEKKDRFEKVRVVV